MDRGAVLGRHRFACQIVQAATGDDLQHIGASDRVRHRAKHEMQAPDDLRLRYVGQRVKKRPLVTIDHLRVLAGKKGADELGRIGQRTTQQAQEGHPAERFVLAHAQERAEESFEDLRRLERRTGGLRFEPVERLQALIVQPRQTSPKNLAQQGLLGPEVIVDRGQVDLGGAGDQAHRSRLVTVLHEQPLRDIEDALARIVIRPWFRHLSPSQKNQAARPEEAPTALVQQR